MDTDQASASSFRNGILLIVAIVASVGVAIVVGSAKEDAKTAAPAPDPAHAEGLPGLPPDHPPLANDAAELPPGHPPIEGHAAEPGHPSTQGGHGQIMVAPGSIAPAEGEGAVTVSQLFRDAAKREGTRVRVAAKVVRATPNVLGKTWLRVSDGSGAQERGDHELVVTTLETPQPGDVVVLEGVVARNKDLGSGYRYDVLLEDATVTAGR